MLWIFLFIVILIIAAKPNNKARGWQDLGKSIQLFDNQNYYFINNGNNLYLNTELNLGYGKFYDGGAYTHQYVILPNTPISSDHFYALLNNPPTDTSDKSNLLY